MSGFQNAFQAMTDFELAVLIGLFVVGILAVAILARRLQPHTVRAVPVGGSSAVPADLAAIEDKIRAFDGRMGEFEHDLKQVRTMLNALPTKDSVHQLALTVSEVKGDLKLNNAQTETTAKTVERIMNWLMEDAKTKAGAK